MGIHLLLGVKLKQEQYQNCKKDSLLLLLLFRDQQILQQLGFVSNSAKSMDRSAAETVFEINMHLL